MITKIKADLLQARKDKDDIRKKLLGVLVGEIQLQETRTGKIMDNSEIIKCVKKLKKSCDENVERGVIGAQQESTILEAYIPKEMTKVDMIAVLLANQELMEEIRTADNRMRLMGKVKKFMSEDGQPFDGGLLSQVLREIV